MANKKIIVSESMLKNIIAEGLISETSISDVVSSKEFEKKVKSISTDIIKNDKSFEKEVKKIIIDALSETFKVLWQRGEFWKGMVK